MTVVGYLMVMASFMALHAFFAGMETGVISIQRLRLRHFLKQGLPGARMLQEFLDNPDRLLGTTLVGTNACLVITSVTAASFAVHTLRDYGESVSTPLTAALVLLFCEYVPKAWFYSRPLERCRRFVRFLRLAELILRPISVGVVGLTRWLIPGPAKAFSRATPFVTKEDLKILAREGEKEGVLSPRERFMIHQVFELSGKKAGQIMIPRSRMTFVHSDTSLKEFFEIARKSDFTRLPVFDRQKNAFVGIVNVFFILTARVDNDRQTVAKFARRPLLVPETMAVDDILPRLRRDRQPMCLVVNDKSEVAGLITTEDILEEIVGKL